MATQVQFRRGTTSQNNAFTGAQGEITVDTDVYALRIHDGTTAGGKVVPTLTATQTFTNKTFGSGNTWNGNVIGLTYGGTGAAITAVAGAVAYSTGSVLGLSAAGTSGQVLTSGGTSAPTWINASGITVGTATNATNATNIAGGSAGYLVYQSDTNTTAFITPGTDGYLLKSTGASTAPTWIAPSLTIGSTSVSLGGTTTNFAGLGTLASVSTSHWTLPVGSVAQRPGTPATGMIRYNSELSTFEGYAASAWGSLGGVKSVDGYTYVLAETSAGAGNGDLDFYAENSGGNGATQVGQWNRTNLKDYTGTVVGTQTTQNVFNATATTVNAFGASTATTVGATTGTHTVRNATLSLPNATAITTGQTTVALLNTTATTVNAFGAATALNLGAATGTLTVANTTLAANAITASTTLAVTGDTTLTGDLAINGGDLTSTATTFNALTANATTVNLATAATTLTIGSGATGATATFQKNVTIVGNLTVQGTTTTSSSASLTVSDSAVYLNNGATDNTKDLGLIGTYVSSGTKYAGLVKDASDSVWKFFSAPTNAPAAGSVVDFTGATYDAVRMGGLTATTGSFSSTLGVTGATTLSAALTYGGVTLSNAVTGTGNMVLATAPSLSALTLTGTLTAGGGVGTNGQYLQSTGTGVQWASLSGTISLAGTTGTGSVSTGGTLTFASSNGVVASVSSSTVTVSTAQDIQTTASPTFNGITTTDGIRMTSAEPFVYTATTCTANVTIPTNYNAMAAGPITVSDGITITIPDGSTLTIV
jgi:hypothetical protein